LSFSPSFLSRSSWRLVKRTTTLPTQIRATASNPVTGSSSSPATGSNRGTASRNPATATYTTQQPQPQPGQTGTAAPGGFPFPFPFPGGGGTAQPTGTSTGTAAPGGFPFPIPGFPGGSTGGSPSGGSGGSAQQIDPALANVATVPLLQMQATHAQGMNKDGGVLAGNFQQGQSLEQQFQLLPGKCYTVIGSGAGISELDLQMFVVTPIQTGSQSVIGGSGNCFRWQAPLGATGKFVMTAKAGSGIGAAQLYSK
jgi:hypothetical protein